ncbi:MAG: thermonuclease family protein [Actinomycetota bacterium]
MAWGRAAVAAVIITLAGPAAARDQVPGPVEAELVRVIDGDTIVVRAKLWPNLLAETHVRLLGVDAPELKGRCDAERELAEKARTFVAGRLENAAIRLFDVRPDKYGGRVLARVEAGGKDLADQLLAAGLARPYHGRRREGWCDD